MRLVKRGIGVANVVSTAAIALSLVWALEPARAVEVKTYVMKLGTATINESTAGAEVAKRKPRLEQAYEVLAAAAKRTK